MPFLFGSLSSGFLVFVLHVILHGFCFYFLFLFLILHGVYVIGVMSYFWWGVLFFCLCTTTSLCIACCPYSVYSFIFFSCYVLCAYFFFSHIPLVFLFPICVSFVHVWMKTFGRCMHMHFIICSYMWILKCVYLTYFVISDVISQDSNDRHVIF